MIENTTPPKYKPQKIHLLNPNSKTKHYLAVSCAKLCQKAQYSMENCNCKNLKVDHIEYSSDKQIVAICFSNRRYNFGQKSEKKQIQQASSSSFCRFQRSITDGYFSLLNIVFSCKFIKHMKWDVDEFVLDCLNKQLPNIFTMDGYKTILDYQLDVIGTNQQTFKQIQIQLQCADLAIRQIKLQLQFEQNKLNMETKLIIKDILSQRKALQSQEFNKQKNILSQLQQMQKINMKKKMKSRKQLLNKIMGSS